MTYSEMQLAEAMFHSATEFDVEREAAAVQAVVDAADRKAAARKARKQAGATKAQLAWRAARFGVKAGA
jgi:hypothetical protein